MNMRNNRRGFTLTELSVVLAVLAIVLTMVVSFTAMINNSRQISSARLEALQDIQVAETVVERFIEGSADITITGDGKSISANGQTLYFEKNNGKIGGMLIAPNTTTNITLDRVTEIKFECYGNGTDKIYYCIIAYTVGNNNYTYTFCVNPYVGESIKEVTNNEG